MKLNNKQYWYVMVYYIIFGGFNGYNKWYARLIHVHNWICCTCSEEEITTFTIKVQMSDSTIWLNKGNNNTTHMAATKTLLNT